MAVQHCPHGRYDGAEDLCNDCRLMRIEALLGRIADAVEAVLEPAQKIKPAIVDVVSATLSRSDGA